MTEKIPDKNVSFAEEEVTRYRNFVRANRCSFSEHIVIDEWAISVQPELLAIKAIG